MAWALGLLIVLALVLPHFLRCRLKAEWRQDKLYAYLCVLGLRIPVTGRNKGKRTGTSYTDEKRPDAGSLVSWGKLILRLLPKLGERLRWERLRIHFCSAFEDPYDTISAYNMAGLTFTALEGLIPLPEEQLQLCSRLDFERDVPELSGELCASLPLGRLLGLLLALAKGGRQIRRATKEG